MGDEMVIILGRYSHFISCKDDNNYYNFEEAS